MKFAYLLLPLILAACASEPTQAPDYLGNASIGEQIKGPQLTKLFSGKTLQTRYVHSDERLTYELYANKKARRIANSGSFQQNGSWFVKGDELCMTWPTANLCYVVKPAGEGYYLTRRYTGVTYGEFSTRPVDIR